MSTKQVGLLGTIISGLFLIFSIYKYNYSIKLYKASGYLTRIWKDRANNYKIMIIVCAAVLLISLIILISSLLCNKNLNTKPMGNSIQIKLQELETLYKDNLITKEEYENKRREIIDRL